MRYTKDNPPDFKPRFATRAAWEVRANALRRRTAIALGLATVPERPPVRATIHGKASHDDYTVEKICFASMPGVYVTGNLYRPVHPMNDRCPVVLHPYGHWPDGRFIWMNDEKIDASLANGSELLRATARSPLQACNATFARMGCIVFQYDMLGYCDSTQVNHAQGFDDADAIQRSQGHMGLQTFNSIRALDFITALPDVDPQRIAVGGASSGGTQTLMLGIVDDRPKAFFIAGMIGMNMQGGCPCENAPLLRLETNNVELCATLAPRHVFCSGATGDWTHDADRRGLPELKHIYQLYDAVDRVDGNVLPWPHNFNAHTRRDFYAFVDRVFALNAGEALVERDFVPILPAELSVFDAAHPRPDDEASIEAIRMRWRPAISAQELLANWIGDVAADEREIPLADTKAVTIELKHITWAGGTCIIRSDGAGTHQTLSFGEIESITILKDKPAWFDFVFNRPELLERARQVLSVMKGVHKACPDGSIRLCADRFSSPAALVACAALPGLAERAELDLNDWLADRIVDLTDDRLFPGLLAAGGVEALIACASPTQIVPPNPHPVSKDR